MSDSLRQVAAECAAGGEREGHAVLEDIADCWSSCAGRFRGFREWRPSRPERAGRQFMWRRRVRRYDARHDALECVCVPTQRAYSVAGGQLRLQALTGDYYGDRDTAQNVVLQDRTHWCVDRDYAVRLEAFDRRGPAGRNHRPQGRHDFQQVRRHQQRARKWHPGSSTSSPVTSRRGSRSGLTHAAAARPDSRPLVKSASSPTARRSGASTPAAARWLPIGRPASIGSGVQVGVYAADNAADGPVVPYRLRSR